MLIASFFITFGIGVLLARPKVVHTPWNKGPNRFEWHRVQDRKRRGVRIIGSWWVLYGSLRSLFD